MLAVLLAAYAVYVKVTGQAGVQGWASLADRSVLLLGAILVSLGAVIAEYLATVTSTGYRHGAGPVRHRTRTQPTRVRSMKATWVDRQRRVAGASFASALQRAGRPLFQPPQRFEWQVPVSCSGRSSRQRTRLRRGPAGRAMGDILGGRHWHDGESRADLAPETAALTTLLACLQGQVELVGSRAPLVCQFGRRDLAGSAVR